MEFKFTSNNKPSDVLNTDNTVTAERHEKNVEASYRAKTFEPTHGRHDAHKHHDTMGEIVQGQGHYDDSFVKYHDDNHVGRNRTKEENAHPQGAGSFETDKDGNCVKRDLKFHHSSIW